MEDLRDHAVYMWTIITVPGSNFSLAAEAVRSHFARGQINSGCMQFRSLFEKLLISFGDLGKSQGITPTLQIDIAK